MKYMRIYVCIKNTLPIDNICLIQPPISDLLPHIHRTNLNVWNAKWTSHSSFAIRYRSIVPEIFSIPWYLDSQSS